MQRKVKNDVKELRAAILQTDAESELKNRLLDGLELQVKSLEDIDPEIIKKNLEDARSYVYGTDTQSRSQRKSEADKQAEADAKSPFKYLAGDKEFKQGGWIGAASKPLQAKVELEATMKAAELGKLRNDSLIMAASNPTYEKIVAFQDKMTAAEKDAIQSFKRMIWQSGGWTEEDVPGQMLPAGASPREGLPLETGRQPSVFAGPAAQAPSTDGAAPQSPSAVLGGVRPDLLATLAEAKRSGMSREEARRLYVEQSKPENDPGSVLYTMKRDLDEQRASFVKRGMTDAEFDALLKLPADEKAIRDALRASGMRMVAGDLDKLTKTALQVLERHRAPK